MMRKFFLILIFLYSIVSHAQVDKIEKALIEVEKLHYLGIKKADSISRWCISESNRLQCDTCLAKSLYAKARVSKWGGYYQLSNIILDEALQCPFAEKSTEFKTKCLMAKGVNYQHLSILSKAQEALLQAYALASQTNNQRFIALVCVELGGLQNKLHNSNKSISYYNRAITYFNSVKDSFHFGFCLSNIAEVYKEQGKIDTSLKNSHEALNIFSKLGSKIRISGEYYNIGQLYEGIGKYDSAKYYYEKSLSLLNVSQCSFYTVIIGLKMSVMNSYLMKKNLSKDYFLTVIDSLKLFDENYRILSVYDDITEYYVNEGDLQNYNYFNDEKKKLIQVKNANEDLQLSREAALISDFISTHKKYNSSTTLTYIISAIGILLLLIISRITYRFYQQKKIIQELNAPDIIPELETDDADYEFSGDSQPDNDNNDEKFQQLFEKIEIFLNDVVNLKNSSLSMEDVAKSIGTNMVYISKAINLNGTNFKTLLNKKRVDLVIKLMNDPSYNKISIKELGNEAGFVNISTYYRVFKHFTGKSPSKFRETLE